MTSEKNNSKNIAITVVIVVIVGAAAFFGGMQYQKTQASSARGQFSANGNSRFGQGGPGGARGARGGFGGAVMGEIVSQDASSITVKLMDGSSKIVNLATTTTFSKSSTGSKADLTMGTKVAVFGTSNSDGSVTAQNVSINPMIRFGGTGGGARPTGQPGY